MKFRGCYVLSAKTLGDALREMSSGTFDVLLVCYTFSAESVEELCAQFRRRFPTGKIVAMEHPGGETSCCAADAFVSADNPEAMVRAVTTGQVIPFKAS